jgi:hypothetical protein
MATVTNDVQLTLDFEPSLVERHRTCMDCIRQSAYTNRNPLKTIAADMDLSESELSRKLAQNPNDTRRFTLDDLEAFIEATGDKTPVIYLAAKYLADTEKVKQAAVDKLMRDLPDLMALLKTAITEQGDASRK